MVDHDAVDGQMRFLPADNRTPVILVAGLDRSALERIGDALEAETGTVQVRHELSGVDDGRVVRTLSWREPDGRHRTGISEIRLAHGCVSCTLREDLLPLLRRLHRRSSVRRIVLTLDPILEPERIAWSIDNVIVDEQPGIPAAPTSDDVRIEATIAAVSEDEWLDHATGDLMLAEIRDVPHDDERTVAQVAVGQVDFADALVVAGCDPTVRNSWESARLMAVLKRLAPKAPMIFELPQRPLTPLLVEQLLAAIPRTSRRGRIDGPHDPLLADEPSLDPDCGVTWLEFHSDRPLHPGRLHDAIDTLLDGVVCARGRLWLATQPDEALWLESAGGGLRVAPGGRWLAAMDDAELDSVTPERRALGALRWDDTHGDRHSSLVVLVHRGDPDHVIGELHTALLTDVEFAAGQSLWLSFDDPFGRFHTDPCEDVEVEIPLAERNSGPDVTKEQP
ncbi:GTPase [Gordonia paraffinivorans]|uniref:ribosome hibernation factor-recruiting GTPase MRF n=1 Tax=Gordonia paraffinivorans TaxID=175628 RepID=UPI0014464433|nr:GTP-binding protein [Gordonia paraffinivorans]MBY4572882.1 GTPase [Gordonia paraffinivorans]